MPKRKEETPILEGMDAYGPPTHLCFDKRFKSRLEDKVEIYGNGVPVVTRDGNIVAVPGEKGWEKPAMICHVNDVCHGS